MKYRNIALLNMMSFKHKDNPNYISQILEYDIVPEALKKDA